MPVNPKITVVLPTYNAAPFLPASIGSALRQSLGDFELLVMDNASTDGTEQVVATFTDPRIRYIRNPENYGFSGNVARGLDLARGDYVTLLGADDILTPLFLERTAASLDEHAATSMVHSDAIWIDETGRPFGESAAQWPAMSSPRDAFINCFRHGFCTSTMMMRRKHLVRPDWTMQQDWGPPGDLALFLWLCLMGDVAYVNTPLVYYRHHARNLSTAAFAEGGLLSYEKWGLDLALSWPAARILNLQHANAESRAYIAARSIQMAHLSRIQGLRWGWFKTFVEALALSPRIALRPVTWARFAFGLLPRRAIQRLQRWRHERVKPAYAALPLADLGLHATSQQHPASWEQH